MKCVRVEIKLFVCFVRFNWLSSLSAEELAILALLLNHRIVCTYN